jgi:hypothetical protein
MTIDKTNGFLKLMLGDEEIVDKASSMERADAAIKVCLVKETLGLSLHDMTEAYQFRVGGERIQGSLKIRRSDGSPSNDAANFFAVSCEFE